VIEFNGGSQRIPDGQTDQGPSTTIVHSFGLLVHSIDRKITDRKMKTTKGSTPALSARVDFAPFFCQ
jgi:hypothetical protein